MIPAFSSELKDKRVDRLLARHGYTHAEIFYSPLKVWVLFSCLFILIGISFILPLVPIIWTSYKGWLLVYIVSAYLAAAFLNNSFAFSGNKLLVVNPNFPFRTFKAYTFSSIKDISIESDPLMKLAWLFGPLGSNFVHIDSTNCKRRFYCAGLDFDCYDENLTKLTLDDLHSTFENKGIPVSIRFDF